MFTETKLSPDLYFDTIWAYQRSAALKTALELNLFTAIQEGSRDTQAIGKAIGAPERGVRILCDFLTSLGFLRKTSRTYELTPDSATFLSKRSPAYLGGTAALLHSNELARQFDDLTETVRRGAPAASVVTEEHPAWVTFAQAMMPMMMPAAQAIADIVARTPSETMRVLDIAAGHGAFGIVLAQRRGDAE